MFFLKFKLTLNDDGYGTDGAVSGSTAAAKGTVSGKVTVMSAAN